MYSHPDPTIAEEYATAYMFGGQRYKVLLQNRVNMEDTDIIAVEHVTHTREDLVTAEEWNIRPYGKKISFNFSFKTVLEVEIFILHLT